MNKVIRTPRISDQRVVLPVEGSIKPVPAEDTSNEGFVGLDQQAEAADLVVGTETETDYTEDEEEVEEEAPEEPEEIPEPELEISAAEIEERVEERLKEFEARYQQEKEDAYRAGFEDGRAEGLKTGQAQSASEIERFQSVVDALAVRHEGLFKTAELDLADLAVAIARNMIGASVNIHSDPVVQAVRDCLSYLKEASRITVKVHPDDLKAVESHREEWLASLEEVEHLAVESDPEIHPGGCLIETPAGDVDARIEERLEKLRNTLIEGLRNAPDERSLEATPEAENDPHTEASTEAEAEPRIHDPDHIPASDGDGEEDLTIAEDLENPDLTSDAEDLENPDLTSDTEDLENPDLTSDENPTQ